MNLAIIILNYRTPSLTLECLGSLQNEVDATTRVVVVDNASDDGSAELIERAIAERGWTSWVTLVRAPRNGGFAAGNNLGMRATRADAYLLLNSDTWVRPGAIASLRKALRVRPDAGIIGAALLDADGHPDQCFFRDVAPASELLRGARLSVLGRLLRGYDPILPRREAPFRPDWVPFAAAVIRREVIDRIGLLDERYFMYFEDVDYCRRARAAGFAVLWWPHARIVHLKGGSSEVTAESARLRRAPRYYYEARARYFAKFYGRVGLWQANLLWHLGRCLSIPLELVGQRPKNARRREALDLWSRALHPIERQERPTEPRARGFAPLGPLLRPRTPYVPPSHADPPPNGASNQNPRDIGLLALIAEDYRTHDSSLLEPGFWAVAVHRFGNARMSIRPRLLRFPFSLAYRVAFTAVNWLWGIDLPYTVLLGRRVRIWHHGGIVLSARAIGDDVHIRHNTTLGVAHRGENTKLPIVGKRVDIGVGTCVLGAVTIGDDCAVGANSVVLRDLPARCTAAGTPARVVRMRAGGNGRNGRQRLTAVQARHHRRRDLRLQG